MERPSQGEQRKADFNRIAANARELGPRALSAIDSALEDNQRMREEMDWENASRWAGIDGLTAEDLSAAFWRKRQDGS